MPEGKLICCGNKFYRSDGHKKTYIKKKDKVLAEKLAVKKYLSALLEDLEKEKSATELLREELGDVLMQVVFHAQIEDGLAISLAVTPSHFIFVLRCAACLGIPLII